MAPVNSYLMDGNTEAQRGLEKAQSKYCHRWGLGEKAGIRGSGGWSRRAQQAAEKDWGQGVRAAQRGIKGPQRHEVGLLQSRVFAFFPRGAEQKLNLTPDAC